MNNSKHNAQSYADADVLQVEEVAHYLRISRASVYEALRRGDIASVKCGGRRLVTRAALQRFLERAESTTAA
jgi:excisionase family DNA binding protein